MFGKKQSLRREHNIFRLLAILVSLLIAATIFKGETFLTLGSFQSMGKQFPEFGIMALAMALTLYTAGIDLSIVAVANLSAVLMAKMLIAFSAGGSISTMAVIAAAIISMIAGASCGLVNGLLIGGLGIAPILATLGTQAFFSGVAIVLTDGSTIGGLPPQMAAFMNADVLGVPVTVIIFTIVALLISFIVGRTTLGLKLRMLGTSVRATTFSGFNTLKLYAINYTLSGWLAAISGLIMLGRFNSAKADYGSSYLMQCILIAVLGGMDPNGGKGTMRGVVVSVLIVQVISSWINSYEFISPFYRQIVWGVLLIFVLIYNYYENQRARKKAMKS